MTATADNPERQRLDQVVAKAMPDLSRAQAAKLIENGSVQLNGLVVTKSSLRIPIDADLAVDFDPHRQQQATAELDLPVIYEDDACIVINKPVGLLSHSKGAFNPEATVASWLATRKGIQLAHGERAGIVHRLDRATSGVMICAKTPQALQWLQKQFSTRKVKKTYMAIINDRLEPPAAIVDMPIERNPKNPATFRVGPQGKPATTAYHTMQASSRYSLLKLEPQTGRTHQLRVHLKYLGHPIVGDTFYGGEVADRLYLHAFCLELTLPDHNRQQFIAPLPEAFTVKMEQ